MRWENGFVVHVDEAGEAIEGDVFEARPLDERVALPDVALPDIPQIASERFIVSEGVAVHDYDGIRWTERTRRVHVSLTHAPLRATLDLADFDFDVITRIDLRNVEERTFESIRLAPHVFASFLPDLDIEKEQMPAPHDGRGKPIECMRVSGDPPNVYRPSYRVRPVPAWFNLRAIPFGVIDREAPEAIARLDDGLLVIHDGRAFVARPRIDIKAVGESERWYPYAAGSFGAEAMI